MNDVKKLISKREVAEWPTGKASMFEYIKEAMDAGVLDHPHLRNVRQVIKDSGPSKIGPLMAFNRVADSLIEVAHLLEPSIACDWAEARMQNRQVSIAAAPSADIRFVTLLLIKLKSTKDLLNKKTKNEPTQPDGATSFGAETKDVEAVKGS